MRLLVHLTTGAENPTKAALALLVASTASSMGHNVDVFVAGDGVTALRADTVSLLRGVGTGEVELHLATLRERGAGLFASKMSAAARGISVEDLAASGFVASPPDKLVELIASADRTISY